MVKKVWRTDGQTDRQTDRRTDWTSHIAAWSQLKNVCFCGLNHVEIDILGVINELHCCTDIIHTIFPLPGRVLSSGGHVQHQPRQWSSAVCVPLPPEPRCTPWSRQPAASCAAAPPGGKQRSQVTGVCLIGTHFINALRAHNWHLVKILIVLTLIMRIQLNHNLHVTLVNFESINLEDVWNKRTRHLYLLLWNGFVQL